MIGKIRGVLWPEPRLERGGLDFSIAADVKRQIL
jgi:hypothetical protein